MTVLGLLLLAFIVGCIVHQHDKYWWKKANPYHDD